MFAGVLDKWQYTGASCTAVDYLTYLFILAKDETTERILCGVAAVYAYAAERRYVDNLGKEFAELVAERPLDGICSGRYGSLAIYLHLAKLGFGHSLLKPPVLILDNIALVFAVDVEFADGVGVLSGDAF